MNGLTQAEFYKIVEFLFRSIWSESFRLSNFSDSAEGVLCIARLLKYPFSLPKSVLTSLAPHHLPTIIGFLGWLAELVEIDLNNGIGPTTARKADDEMPVDELWLQYLTSSFRERRDPAVVAEIDAEFVDQLQQRISTAQAAVDELADRAAALKDTIDEEQKKANSIFAEADEMKKQTKERRGDIPKLEALIGTLDAQRKEQEARCEAKVDECTGALERVKGAEARVAELRETMAALGISERSHRNAVNERSSARAERETVQGLFDARQGGVDEAKIALLRKMQESNAKLGVLRSHLPLREAGSGNGKEESDRSAQLAQDPSTGLLDTNVLIQVHTSLKSSVRKELDNRRAVLKTKIALGEKERDDKEDTIARLEAEVAGLKKALEASQDEWEALARKVESEARGLKAEANEHEAAALRARAESRGFVDSAANALAEARRGHEDAVREEGHKEARIGECKAEYLEGMYYLSEALVEHKDSVEKALQYLKEQSEHLLTAFEREAVNEENDIKDLERICE